jgi:hypothetical protein
MFPSPMDEYEVAFRQTLAEAPIPSPVIGHLFLVTFLQYGKQHQ